MIHITDTAPASGKYICGCSIRDKERYRIDLLGDGKLSNKRIIGGEEVCPEHGEPIAGYRSPLKDGPNGSRIDNSIFSSYKGKLDLDFSEPDIRDTRDPNLVGMEILFKSNGHNGNITTS